MAWLQLRGEAVEIDRAGFLVDGSRWTPEVAEVLARTVGVAPPDQRHRKVITLAREHAARTRTTPGLPELVRASGCEESLLRRLFHGSPRRLIPLVAGPRRAMRREGRSHE